MTKPFPLFLVIQLVCITDINELNVSICIIISIPSLLLENFVDPVKIVMPAKNLPCNVLYLS